MLIVDMYGEPGGSILNKMVRNIYGADQAKLNYREVAVRVIKDDRWMGVVVVSDRT